MGDKRAAAIRSDRVLFLHTDFKYHWFRVACIEQVHCVSACRMGSRTTSFVTKSCACASIAFLVEIIPAAVDYGFIPSLHTISTHPSSSEGCFDVYQLFKISSYVTMSSGLYWKQVFKYNYWTLKKSYLHTFVVIIFYLLNRSRTLNKTKATGFFETYSTTQRHVPEEPHTTCCSSFSSFWTLTLQALLGHPPPPQIWYHRTIFTGVLFKATFQHKSRYCHDSTKFSRSFFVGRLMQCLLTYSLNGAESFLRS
jgi:hypothetical protein